MKSERLTNRVPHFYRRVNIFLIIPSHQNAIKNINLNIWIISQASLEQEISRRGGVINQFISLTREILRRFIQQFFPTDIHLNVSMLMSLLVYFLLSGKNARKT